MKIVTSKDGTTIAYEQSGKGAALILVDGALCYRAHRGQRPLAEQLAPHFTVYIYDRRGRGESSDTQPYAVEREIEDIDALIDTAGGTTYLYGISSGSVLALKAAAKLGAKKVTKLALYEPPFNSDDAQAKQEFAQYTQQMAELIDANKRDEALAFFMADMAPPEMIDEMRKSPDWSMMKSIAHTLAYDNAVLGDGAVPTNAAKTATMPTLVMVGSGSPDFKHEAVAALAKAMPHAQQKTIEAQPEEYTPEAPAPALIEFFSSSNK